MNASNLYLGLKTGWTFSAHLFGTIVGFAVLKSISKAVPSTFPILGGDFGPRENNIVQTCATAAGGMSNVFVSALPAIYQLKLLDTPKHDFWRITALTAVGGYFGFAFATPLRKFFIIYVARELKLVFPSSSATAMTIRSMHLAIGGEKLAKLKMKALSIAFACAFTLRVVSQYCLGILWDWHIFTWFYIWGNYKNFAINVENWGWMIEFTPAFIGVGMLVGLNVAFSFFFGSVLAWGIIGPCLVHYGAAYGVQVSKDPKWHELISFASLSEKSSRKTHPSPRFWLLWPGVLCMIVVSFVELGCQWRVLVFAGKALYRACWKGIADVQARTGRRSSYVEKHAKEPDSDMVEDPAGPRDQIKMWMWLPLLLMTIILICVVMGVSFSMPVGESLLAITLAFFFSLLAVQCNGATDITPLTAASKASQIVLGGATKGEHWNVSKAQRLNLLGGAIASIGANQASDLTADFRVGFLLRTPPKLQFFAQGISTAVAVFLAPAMFVLFSSAYPCINDVNAKTCAFSAPSVAAWRAVAVAVTDPTFPVPTSSGIFSIVFSIIGATMVLIRHFVLVGKREWVRKYWPNMMVMALAFVLPQTVYGTAMVMGATVAAVWLKKSKEHFDMYGYAVAAGLIAGEGIGGVVNAIFQIAGISGSVYGTNIACPGNAC